jgi:hypothetical protein
VCEREWEVFFKLEMEFGSCSCVGREIGVSIYRWGFKTSRWTDFGCGGPVESPQRLGLGQADSQAVCQTGRLQVRLQKQVLTPVEPPLGPVQPPGGQTGSQSASQEVRPVR